MSDSANPNTTPKDAYGYDAMSTYLPIDGLGINALQTLRNTKGVSSKIEQVGPEH